MVLYYDSAHNFNKYSVLNFNKLSSIESKLDTQNKFYKDFIKLQDVKSKTQERRRKKISALNNASLLHDELIRIYKKEYDQVFENKNKKWRLKNDHDNLKDLNYQPDQSQPDQIVLRKLVKVSKERSNEILDTVTEAKKNKLNTTWAKKYIH